MQANINHIELLSERIKLSTGRKFMQNESFHFSFDIQFQPVIEDSLNKIGLKYLVTKAGSLEIDFSGTFFFFDVEDFFSRYESNTQSEDEFNKSSIIILQCVNNLVYKLSNDVFSKENAIIFNYRTYRALIDYLIQKETFIEYHNEITKEFIIVSQQGKKGVLKIGYETSEVKLHELPDLSLYFEKITTEFSKKEFIIFFRDRVFEVLETKTPVKERFYLIAKSLDKILEKAEKDYQIFLKEFNLDNIKSRFKEQREKYFENLDKNLEGINKQIGSIPLTFSASAFAAYQVKEKTIILFLIFIVYLIYTSLSLKTLGIIKLNISTIKGQKSKESDNIKDQSNEVYVEFKNDFENVDKKIQKLESVMSWVKCSLWILLFSFLFFVIFQLTTPKITQIQEKIIFTL